MTTRPADLDDAWIGRRNAMTDYTNSRVRLTLADTTTITGELMHVAQPLGATDQHSGYAILWAKVGDAIGGEAVAVDLADIVDVTAGTTEPGRCDNRAAWRIAILLTGWAADRGATRLDELSPRAFGEGLGLATALAVALQRDFGGSGENYSGDHAMVADAVAYARGMQDDIQYWIDNEEPTPARAGRGRPPIGPEVKTRIPQATVDLLEADANTRGVDRSEVIRRIVAAHYGAPR